MKIPTYWKMVQRSNAFTFGSLIKEGQWSHNIGKWSRTPMFYTTIHEIFSAVINTIKAEINLFKLWIRIQQYTATAFQGR